LSEGDAFAVWNVAASANQSKKDFDAALQVERERARAGRA
jgi:hypothetical protein